MVQHQTSNSNRHFFSSRFNAFSTVVLGCLVAMGSASSAFAETASGSLSANTSVSSTCTISSGSTEGNRSYDPTAEYNPRQIVRGTVSDHNMHITCTQGTPPVTLLRDTGLYTTCEQNGLAPYEGLMKSEEGYFLPYILLFSSNADNNLPHFWSCSTAADNSMTVFDFATTTTQYFTLNFYVNHSLYHSNEAKRLLSIAHEGVYTDTITLNVNF